MKSFKPLLIIFALTGLFWACETTDPFVDEVQVFMFTGDFEGALEIIEAALAEDENNYMAHYYKGNVLAAQAEELEDPRDRKTLYERARVSFDTAKGLMMDLEETPDELQELEETVIYYWAEEFNSGVNILNDDSTFAATPDPNFTAIAHFDNSIAVLPDSALPYQVKASAYFNEDDVDNAVSSYENAMDRLPNPEIADYEFMISILLVQPNYDRAIYYSERARADFPDETVFVQLQADAYLQAGQQDEAIALVEGLIADDPDNPQYRRVLGTQIYQRVGEISDSVSSLYEEAFELRRQIRNLSGSQRTEAQSRLDRMEAEIDQKEMEMDELTELSVSQMKRVVELEPDSESAHFILGIIYQNRAASLFERRNNTEDNAEAQDLDERARENLKEALVYYERAAEIDPDNPENWQSLFQVYTTLGMEEEAMEAMERAGF
jgi:tetratricopeptide (TPR) repeat protein